MKKKTQHNTFSCPGSISKPRGYYPSAMKHFFIIIIINSLIHFLKNNYSSDYSHENLESYIKDILIVR